MTEQWKYLIDKFHANGNVLKTIDFATDIHLACEYRRLLSSDLPKKGYVVARKKINPKCWQYTLMESQPELLKEAV